MALPAGALTGLTQERMAWPSSCTVHAPQSAIPQPNFVPVMPSTSRRTQSTGMSDGASISRFLPLIVSSIAALPAVRTAAFLWRHPDDQFSEVVPLQHSDESTWRVFETVDDVLAVANATRGDARTNLAQEVGIVFGREVVVDEAAYGQPLRENLPHGRGEPIRTVARWDAVVLRNEPGDRNACKIVEQRQHGFPDGSADVLEVNVDAVWTCRGQSRRKIGGAMIDRGVEAELVLHEGAFLRAAGDADGSRAGELGELSDERPDRTAGRGDDHGLPGLRLADRAQAAVRREPGHSEHAETGRDWCNGRIQFAKARAVRERVRAPSCSRQDDVTFDIRGIVRDEHMRHCFPGHHLADLEWLGIRLSVVHTAAHIRVEGEVLHPEQKLAGCRARDRGLFEAEVGELRLPLRSGRENDLSPTRCHDAHLFLVRDSLFATLVRPRHPRTTRFP